MRTAIGFRRGRRRRFAVAAMLASLMLLEYAGTALARPVAARAAAHGGAPVVQAALQAPLAASAPTITDDVYSDAQHQWGLFPFSGMSVPGAWNEVATALGGGTPQPVVVAVVDTGVDATHPDLSGRVLPGENTIDGSTNTVDDAVYGHGTLAAGVIAALTDNGIGIAGIGKTYPVQVLPVKAVDGATLSATPDDLAAAIRWVTDWRGSGGERARIIDVGVAQPYASAPSALADAVQYAESNGVLVVAAAGEDALPVSGFYPAALGGVLSVGAAEPGWQLTAASNTGAALVAPGAQVFSTVPGGGYAFGQGTYLAAAAASGVAALTWLADPGASAGRVSQALQGAMESQPCPGAEIATGACRLLDASTAVQNVLDTTPPGPPTGLTWLSDGTHMHLTWTAPSAPDVASYRVLRGGRLVGTTAQTQFDDSGLTPGTTYDYQVEAVDRMGNVSAPAALSVTPQTTPAVGTVRASVYGAANQAAGISQMPAISADGRYVAFQSAAANLVPNDTNGYDDIFVRDLQSGSTERVSVTSAGGQANGVSEGPLAVSAHGRYVLFHSYATNLTAQSKPGLFVHDRQTGRTVWISDGMGGPRNASMSADGRYVVYLLQDPSGTAIYLHDRDANGDGVFDETTKPGGVSDTCLVRGENPQISADGRYVAFLSSAALVPSDTNGTYDVYVYTVATGKITRVSVASDGSQANAGSFLPPAISADGRYVAFDSWATNLTGQAVPGDEIYLHDRDANGDGVFDESAPGATSTQLVSVSDAGAPGDSGNWATAVSAGGRYVAFLSYSDNLVYGDTNQDADLFLRDRAGGRTIRMSVGNGGVQADLNNFYDGSVIGLSADGSTVTYASEATNLVAGDTNHSTDVFVSRLAATPPSWPAGSSLRALDVGQTLLTLQWTPAVSTTGVTHYRVYQGGTAVATVAGTVYSAQMTGLAPGTSYTFRVAAGDAAGQWSSGGPSVTATTLTATGGGTAGLLASAHPGGVVDLTWDPSGAAGVTGYAIWRATGGGAAAQVGTVQGAGATSFRDTGLAADTTYTYSVHVIASGGAQSPYTVSRQVSTPPLAIAGVTWSAARTLGGRLRLGTDLAITVTGEPNRTAVAQVVYSPAGTGGTITASVSLTEDPSSPGTYRGTWPLRPGVAAIQSLTGQLSDGAGHQVQTAGRGLPVGVSGLLAVTLDTPAAGLQAIAGGRLLAWSQAGHTGGQQSLTTSSATVELGLDPADDYSVRLLAPGTQYRLAVAGGVSVQAGRLTRLTLTPHIPTALRVRVIDDGGAPVAGAHVSITPAGGGSPLIIDTGADGWTAFAATEPYGTAGVEVQARGDPVRYLDAASLDLTLQPGAQQARLTLPLRPVGSVHGKLTDQSGQGVADARVTATDVFDPHAGWSTTRVTTTGAGGTYRFDGLPAGEITLTATRSGWADSRTAHVTLAGGQDAVADMVLPRVIEATVSAQIYTRSIGGLWVGPLTFDWRTAYHYHLKVYDPAGHAIQLGPNTILDNGGAFRGCVDGREAGYPQQCATATPDARGNVVLQFRLQEQGRIVGQVVDGSTGKPLASSSSTLYRITASGTTQYVPLNPAQVHNSGGALAISVPRKGRYLLRVRGGGGAGQVTVDLSHGGIVDVGQVRVNANQVFTGSANAVTATPAQAVPGGAIAVRVTYRNARPVQGARLLLGVPGGTSLVPGSVTLNGQTASATVSGSTATLALGDLAAPASSSGAAGVVRYRLRVDDPLAASVSLIGIAAGVSFDGGSGPVQENLGEASVQVPGVSLVVPGSLGRLQTVASGRAPAGSTVQVLDGAAVLGTATASPGGYWSAPVSLPDLGGPATYSLTAQARSGSDTWTSDAVRAYYDPDQPVLATFTMQQADGRRLTLDPTGGVARFPYVYVPGDPFIFQLTFTHADRVYGVQVRLGNEDPVPAQRQPDGSFKATVVPTAAFPGAVTFSYHSKPDLSRVVGGVSLAEIESQVAPGMRDFQMGSHRTWTDASGTHAEIAGTLPHMDGIRMDSQVTVGPQVAYQPTAADAAQAQATGVPVYGFSFTWSEQKGQFVAEVRGYIPVSDLPAGTAAVGRATVLMAAAMSLEGGAARGGAPVQLASGSTVGTYAKPVALRMVLGSTLYNLYQLARIPGELDSLLHMVINAATRCDKPFMSNVRQAAAKIAKDIMASALTRTGLMATGGVMLATGVGSVIGAGFVGASFLFNFAMQHHIDGEMNFLKHEIDTSPQCKPHPQPPGPPGPKGPGDGGGTAANPTWIEDPSGTVYEAVYGNPVPGVTATVLSQDPSTGAWSVWDASGFGQDNPLLTDAQGRYGWDVPPGKWQVLFQKSGYETARSPVVTVPPPATGVDVGLVSLAPPQVSAVSAAPDAVDVSFDSYVLASSLTGATVSVSLYGSDTPLAGSVAPLDPVADDQGVPVARAARFTPSAPLALGMVLAVHVDSIVQSCAGIPLTANVTRQVTVAAPDTTPPGEVSGAVATPGDGILTLGWTDPTDADFSQVRIAWRTAGSGSFSAPVTVPKGFGAYAVTGLTDGIAYQVRLSTVEFSGNVSAGVVVSGTPQVPVNSGGGGVPLPANAPMVTAIRPHEGPAAGGTAVTVTGSGFTGATIVDFGARAATRVTVDSATQLTVVAPPGTGSVDVTVTTPAGTSATSAADRFSYTPAAPAFADVPAGYWAAAAIDRLVARGVINGFPDGSFRPADPVTRAQFVKMLVLALGLKPGSGRSRFTDVAASDWFGPYVVVAVRAGIVAGITPTTFGPDQHLTREQMAVLLGRALRLSKTATLTFKDDRHIDAWALQGVEAAVAAGYLDGFPDGTLQPRGTATRAQAAKVLAMVLDQQAPSAASGGASGSGGTPAG